MLPWNARQSKLHVIQTSYKHRSRLSTTGVGRGHFVPLVTLTSLSLCQHSSVTWYMLVGFRCSWRDFLTKTSSIWSFIVHLGPPLRKRPFTLLNVNLFSKSSFFHPLCVTKPTEHTFLYPSHYIYVLLRQNGILHCFACIQRTLSSVSLVLDTRVQILNNDI